MRGFEPLASAVRGQRSTGLSYTPRPAASVAKGLVRAVGRSPLRYSSLRGGAREGLRWAAVASRLSRPFHPDVKMHQLAADPDNDPQLGDITPMEGSFPLSTLESLVTFSEGGRHSMNDASSRCGRATARGGRALTAVMTVSMTSATRFSREAAPGAALRVSKVLPDEWHPRRRRAAVRRSGKPDAGAVVAG